MGEAMVHAGVVLGVPTASVISAFDHLDEGIKAATTTFIVNNYYDPDFRTFYSVKRTAKHFLYEAANDKAALSWSRLEDA